MAKSADAHIRWNFVVIVLDASGFMAGMASVDRVAVLLILLSNLIWTRTASAVGMSLICAYVNDCFRSRTMIRAVASLVVLTPLSALLVPAATRMLNLEELTGHFYSVVFL